MVKEESSHSSRRKKTCYLECVGGERILLDYPISDEIKRRKWRVQRFGRTEKFVVNIENGRMKCLHYFLLPNFVPNSNITVYFKNEDRFDYRRRNLEVINKNEAMARRSAKPVQTKYVIQTQSTISRNRNRSLECAACSLKDYENHYRHCLNAACEDNWEGWIIESGNWCMEIRASLESEKKLNNKIKGQNT